MHMYTTDFLNVMDEHTTAVSYTVSLDLTYFSNKFIESGFITQTAASEVLSKLGVSAGDKSRELLHLARQNYKTSLKKQVWADKFIAIFSSQAAYSDLATLLRGETSTAGVANIAISSTNCCEITPTLFIPRSNGMILYWTRTVQVFILNLCFLSIFTLELCFVCHTALHYPQPALVSKCYCLQRKCPLLQEGNALMW